MEKGEWRSGDICWDSPRMTVISNDVEAHAERKKRRRFTGASCQVPFCGNPLELQYHKVSYGLRQHFRASGRATPPRPLAAPPPARQVALALQQATHLCQFLHLGAQ